MNERHELNDMDSEILESIKSQLNIHVEYLIQRNLRRSTIEIILTHYIKSLLRKE